MWQSACYLNFMPNLSLYYMLLFSILIYTCTSLQKWNKRKFSANVGLFLSTNSYTTQQELSIQQFIIMGYCLLLAQSKAIILRFEEIDPAKFTVILASILWFMRIYIIYTCNTYISYPWAIWTL